MVQLIEHKSEHYAPRTWHNAITADLTIALATNFETRGEKLTKLAAKNKYLAVDLNRLSGKDIVDKIINACVKHKVQTLNVAGNSIQTFYDLHDFLQADVNSMVFRILQPVFNEVIGMKVVSGGQSGTEWAAGVTCHALSIPCVMTFPKGFKQRNVIGQDLEIPKDVLIKRLVRESWVFRKQLK